MNICFILKSCFQQPNNKRHTFSFKKRFLALVIKEEQLKVIAMKQKSSRSAVILFLKSPTFQLVSKFSISGISFNYQSQNPIVHRDSKKHILPVLFRHLGLCLNIKSETVPLDLIPAQFPNVSFPQSIHIHNIYIIYIHIQYTYTIYIYTHYWIFFLTFKWTWILINIQNTFCIITK